ncbi:MFS transporter [Sphingomonas daechungensis]|uniref:MFS transporter n=1 Tax=Sphingomonas daechungensis TaxID=1176646 RepID=UPI0037835FDE
MELFDDPSARTHRLARAFSNVGHGYSHLLTLLFPTVVLSLDGAWGLSYGELLALMLGGQILFGAAALPAGWLGDRWSAVGMMIVYFVGTGAAAVATGFARSPGELALGLAVTGLFGSIYHPVGMAWLVRVSEHRGRALGVNGVYGAVGIALAPLVAGVLSDSITWRAAFIVPGATAVLVGVALLVCVRTGRVTDSRKDISPTADPARGDAIRAFVLLTLTMSLVGLMGSSFMVMLPKLFSDRLAGITEGSAVGVGALVSIVYLCAASAQYFGGRLADRYSMRNVYLVAFAIQAPVLAATAFAESWTLLLLSIAMVFVNVGSLPSENGMLAHFTPGKWRATAYGAKFVLALGVGAGCIPLVGQIYDRTGGFFWLFAMLSACAAIVAIVAAFLPDDKSGSPVVASPAPQAAE